MIELAEYISLNYSGKVVEIGIGHRFDVAVLLAKKGLRVIAVDNKQIKTPKEIEFYVDDVTNPKIEIYERASLIYSIRPPPELFAPIKTLAKKVRADCIIKPLYGDYPGGELRNYKGLYFYLIRYES